MKFGELRVGDIFEDVAFGYNMKIGYHTAEDDNEVNAVNLDTGITHWWCDDEEVRRVESKTVAIKLIDNGITSSVSEV